MKTAFRFTLACLFVFGLNAHASQPVQDHREPVILDLYRAVHRGMTNVPVTAAATGVAILVGFRTGASISENLVTKALLPMASAFFATLLLGNYLAPQEQAAP